MSNRKKKKSPLRWYDIVALPALGAAFLTLYYLEKEYPLRKQRFKKRRKRTTVNSTLAVANLPVVRVATLPLSYTYAANLQSSRVTLQQVMPGPRWLRFLTSLVLMDYAQYLWHRALHTPLLWRIHQVHHSDLDMDVSTGLRYHTLEQLASIPYRMLVVRILGPEPAALITYDMMLGLSTLWQHSNIRLPERADEVVQNVIPTPSMHSIHHSTVQEETNSNFSMVFSIWDRLHNTYKTDISERIITTGLPYFRKPGDVTIEKLLEMPFNEVREWTLPDGRIPVRLGLW